ncbi:MAG: GNAT family N-acetyltransferase [Pseudomonadota bacterium]
MTSHASDELLLALMETKPAIFRSQGPCDALYLYPALVWSGGDLAALLNFGVAGLSTQELAGVLINPLPADLVTGPALTETDAETDNDNAREGEALVTPLPEPLSAPLPSSSDSWEQPGSALCVQFEYVEPSYLMPIGVDTKQGGQPLSSNMKRALKASRRKLSAGGKVDCTFTPASSPLFAPYAEQLLTWKHQWLEQQGHWGGALRSGEVEQHLHADGQTGSPPKREIRTPLGIHTLRVDERPVSHVLVAISEQSGSIAQGLLSSYDADMASASPATLHLSCVRDGNAVPDQVTDFDMLPEHGAYKRRFGVQSQRLMQISCARTLRAKYEIFAFKIRALLRRQMRLKLNGLPHTWRRNVVAMLLLLRG